MIYVYEEYRNDTKPMEYAKSLTNGNDEGYCKKERGVGAYFSENVKSHSASYNHKEKSTI